MNNKQHYFGEKNTEMGMPVWRSPKFEQARKKACEIIDSAQYGLVDEDFWILMNKTKNSSIAYTGLILSHNGCLKINAALPADKKVKPECFTIDKDGWGGSLVVLYRDEEYFEVGEVSPANCKNSYPYAMALKRAFDRVVLKKSKIAFAGIYSEAESDDFRQSEQPVPQYVQTQQPVPQYAQVQQPVPQYVQPQQPVPQYVQAQYAQTQYQPTQTQYQQTQTAPVSTGHAGNPDAIPTAVGIEMSLNEALSHTMSGGSLKGASLNAVVATENEKKLRAILSFYANNIAGMDGTAAKTVLNAVNNGIIRLNS